MTRVYLDTNVLVAYYSADRTEDVKKEQVRNALAAFAQLKQVLSDCRAQANS